VNDSMWGRWGRNHSARRYCGNMTARSYWPNRSACSATARQLSAASVHLPGVPTSGGIAGVFGAWKSEQSLISLVIRLACLTAVRIKVPQARWAASPLHHNEVWRGRVTVSPEASGLRS
jgi:hypothetical protein